MLPSGDDLDVDMRELELELGLESPFGGFSMTKGGSLVECNGWEVGSETRFATRMPLRACENQMIVSKDSQGLVLQHANAVRFM